MGDWQRRRSLSFFVAGLCYLLAANLPRFGASARMVRVSGVEPSTLEVDFVDGSMFRAGPSTLMPHIADSAGIRC